MADTTIKKSNQVKLTYTAVDLAKEMGTSDRNLSQNWLPKLEWSQIDSGEARRAGGYRHRHRAGLVWSVHHLRLSPCLGTITFLPIRAKQ